MSHNSPQRGAKTVHRFAHPFYTNIPKHNRAMVPGVGNRMTDFSSSSLLPIPEPPPIKSMTLNDIIGEEGTTQIQQCNKLIFHAVGDTGNEENGIMQELVSNAMCEDFDINNPGNSPAFFLHLGDVNYYDNTDQGYYAQFYSPYKKYPGKIIAIPGNHDGELFKFDNTSTGQKNSLDAFIKNFCNSQPTVPEGANGIYRQMVSQPGVYWQLNTPFADILGLYTNVDESQGYITSSIIGHDQFTWLINTLKKIHQDRASFNIKKALIIAVHHPPYSNGGHHSSNKMLADMDKACEQSGIWPDAVLAAHSHDYQRYTRDVVVNNETFQIPYFVAGGGGRGLSRFVKPATGERDNDHTYDSSYLGYGYLKISITLNFIQFQFYKVEANKPKTLFETIEVDIVKHTVKKQPR